MKVNWIKWGVVGQLPCHQCSLKSSSRLYGRSAIDFNEVVLMQWYRMLKRLCGCQGSSLGYSSVLCPRSRWGDFCHRDRCLKSLGATGLLVSGHSVTSDTLWRRLVSVLSDKTTLTTLSCPIDNVQLLSGLGHPGCTLSQTRSSNFGYWLAIKGFFSLCGLVL